MSVKASKIAINCNNTRISIIDSIGILTFFDLVSVYEFNFFLFLIYVVLCR